MKVKYKIGYATGVFDLFHIGHLNLLRSAKEYCEFLIVGVSIDEIVTYKANKPVIPFSERIKIVEAIKYVDKAVPQVELDKYKAWKEIGFNVLFHGDDLKDDPIWEVYEDKLKKEGVDIIYIPYTKDVSSSLIRHKIIDEIKPNIKDI